MNSSAVLADLTAAALWLSLVAFAVLGGADFGAGVWDLFASGQSGEQQRGALIRAIGPIWEGNEIWLIFLLTGTWTAFPLVFSSLMTALFIPLTLALLGVVMRGAAFAYYTHFRAAVSVNVLWGRTFSIASLVAPFLFGAVAAAVASGQIVVSSSGHVTANVITSWTTPFTLSCGCLAVSACSCLAATYMTVEANNQHATDLERRYTRRALLSGVVSALLGIISGWLAIFFAPYLFNGLTTRALPLALAGVGAGIFTAVALLLGFYRIARLLVAGAVALVLGAWAVAQLPYLIVSSLTITQAAAPPGVLAAVLIATLASMFLVLPATWYMFYLFKSAYRRGARLTTNQFIESLEKRAEERSPTLALDERSAEQHDGARRIMKGVAGLSLVMGIAAVVSILCRFWRQARARSRSRNEHHSSLDHHA